MVDLKTILVDFCFCCCTRTGNKLVDPFRDNALLYFDLLWYSEDIIDSFRTLSNICDGAFLQKLVNGF